MRIPMRYAVVIEKAIELHLSGMREDGIPLPPPSSQVDYIDVAA